MPTPSHSGACQPDSYSGRAQVGEVSSENEPTCQACDQADEDRAFADAVDEATGPHELVGRTDRRHDGADQTDHRRPQYDAGRTVAIDQQAIEYGQRYVGQADHRGKIADLRLREATLAEQQIGDRPDRIRFIIAGENGNSREQQCPPAQRRAAGAVVGATASRDVSHLNRAKYLERVSTAGSDAEEDIRQVSRTCFRLPLLWHAYAQRYCR
jgi:hypothetical protein